MKKILSLSAAALLIAGVAFGQEKKAGAFEGSISFMQYNGIDTTYFSYDVKTTHVRIVNTDIKTNNDEGIYLIDLTTKTTLALSPVRKIYKDQPSPAAVKPSGTPKVTKTTNTKTINGYKCTEYDVVDAEEGIKVTYWIATGNFEFFLPMMNILNRKDKFSQYYMVIPSSANMFPMEAYETDMSGVSKGFIKATKVTTGKIANGTFEIPEGYHKFEK